MSSEGQNVVDYVWVGRDPVLRINHNESVILIFKGNIILHTVIASKVSTLVNKNAPPSSII